MAKYYAPTSSDVTIRELEHQKLSQDMAGECIVMLENDGVLPVKTGKQLALYGNGARNTVRGGTGSGDVNSRDSITVEQGLRGAGYQIMTDQWLDRNEKNFLQAKKTIKNGFPKKQ